MPTYTVWSKPNTISSEAKRRIAECITAAHHEEAKAPRFLVQVIFTEIAPDSHFLGGQPAPANQVWVRGDIRSGRTTEQKEKLLLRLTNEIADILGVASTEMMVYLNDIPGANMTEYGPLAHGTRRGRRLVCETPRGVEGAPASPRGILVKP